jgi:multicomponent K+:H+ antiporter subunit G
MLFEIAVSFFLLVGAFFTLVGAIGLARLPDFYMRLHGPTKATTLGVGGTLTASMIFFTGAESVSVHELLITLFLFVTAPVSANLLAKAALKLKLKSQTPVPGADLEARG